MQKFLKRQKLPKLTEEKREHLNSSMSFKEFVPCQLKKFLPQRQKTEKGRNNFQLI